MDGVPIPFSRALRVQKLLGMASSRAVAGLIKAETAPRLDAGAGPGTIG